MLNDAITNSVRLSAVPMESGQAGTNEFVPTKLGWTPLTVLSCITRHSLFVILLLITGYCLLFTDFTGSVYGFESQAPPVVKNGVFQSVQSGDWNNGTTWDKGSVPEDGDTAQVMDTHIVTVTGDQACGIVGINGRLDISGGGTLTIDNGASITTTGTAGDEIRFVNAMASNATLKSAGTATYSGTNAINWNNQTGCRIGGFTMSAWTFSTSGTATVTLVGNVSAVGNPSVGDGTTLAIASYEFYVTNGSLQIGAGGGTQAYLTGGASGSIKLSSSVAGEYGITATSSANINLNGVSSSTRFRIYNDTSSFYSYVLLQDGSDTNFNQCYIYYMGTNAANRYGVTVQSISGSYGGGGGEGLTINASAISTCYNGLRLESCSGNMITSNSFYSCTTANAAGVVFVNMADPNLTFSSNNIYNDYRGILLSNSTGITMTNCTFGQTNDNTTYDIDVEGATNQATLYNTLLASPSEVNSAALNSANSFVVSYKHDQTNGLTRVWGDWKPNGVVKFRYDSQTYSGAGDQNQPKILEFASSAVPTGSQYYADSNGDGIELVGGGATTRTIVRSADGSAYNFVISATSGTALFGGYYYEFQNLGTEGLQIVTANAISSTGGADSGLDYGSFKNNSSATRHLNITTGQAKIADYCSFDASTATYDVRVANGSTITLTNYTCARAVPGTYTVTTGNTEIGAGGTQVTWTGSNAIRSNGTGGGNWNVGASWNGGVVPPANYPVEILAGDVVTVNASIANSPINSLIVTGTLRFDLSSGNPAIGFVNGGSLINNGTIDFLNTSGANYVQLSAQTAGATKWVFSGAQPQWSTGGNDLEFRISDCDYQGPITITGNARLFIFNGSMETDSVTISQTATCQLQTGGSLRTWRANGDITVYDGTLDQQSNSKIEILCGSNGQYGLIVEGAGTISATGTSSASRNCYITSASSYRSYILFKAGAEGRFRYCAISNLGYPQASNLATDTKYGLVADTVGGASNNRILIDTCNISYNYIGIFLRAGTNNNAANNAGFINNTVYNNQFHGIYLYGSTGTRISGNNIYNHGGNYGIALATGSSNNTEISYNTSRNNDSGLFISAGSNNNTITNDVYYSNSSGIYFAGNSSTGNLAITCYIGATSTNTYDIRINVGSGQLVQMNLRNCTLGSSTEVLWTQTAPGAGTYVLSQKHDQTNGLSKIWGEYRTGGNIDFDYTDESYAGAGDTNTQKQLTFASGPSGLNSGKSKMDVLNPDIISILGSAATPTLISAVDGATAYTFIVEDGARIIAGDYRFSNLDENGLQIKTTVAFTILDNNSSATTNVFQNGSSVGGATLLRLDPVSVWTGDETIRGCSFDNSTTYDVYVNIGAGRTVTFQGFTNDNPGTKDNEASGTAVWPTTNFTSTQNGSWNVGSTWVGGQVPSLTDNVTISHTITVDGYVASATYITILSNGILSLEGSAANSEVRVMGGGIMSATGTGVFRCQNLTNPVYIRSGSSNKLNYNNNNWTFNGSGTVNLSLVDYQGNALTIPNGITLNLIDNVNTLTTTIASGATINHQTVNKEWVARGLVTVSGNLNLGADTMVRLNCPSANGESGIEVTSSGKLTAQGTSSDDSDCIITNGGGSGANKPYIYGYSGSETILRYCTVAYVGSNVTTPLDKRGMVFSSVNGSTANSGLTIDGCNVYGGYYGIYAGGCTNNNTANGNKGIVNNWIHDTTYTGLLFGTNNASNTIDNNTVFNCVRGLWLYGNGGGATETLTNCSFSGNTTGDITLTQGGSDNVPRVILRNCTLGSATEVDTASENFDNTNEYVISFKHDKVNGQTRLWGDYNMAAGASLLFNYANESYPGAGDANTQKSLQFGPTAIAAIGNDSRILANDTSSNIQMVGTASSPTLVSVIGGAGRGLVSVTSGALDMNYVTYSTSGVSVSGANSTLTRLDNVTFQSAAETGTPYLTVATGQTKTLNSCSFDNVVGMTTEVSVDWNGSTPTKLIFPTGYSNDNAGAKNQQSNGSEIHWQTQWKLDSVTDSVASQTIYKGDDNVPIVGLKFGPNNPASNYPDPTKMPGILTALKVDRTGTVLDSEIDAIRVWRDDGDGILNTITDTLVSKLGITYTYTAGTVTIDLETPQTITNTVTFFVAYDIKQSIADGRTIGVKMDDYTYYTVGSPHTRLTDASDAFPVQSTNKAINNNTIRMDGQIVKAESDPNYLGDNVYNTSGANQTETKFTNTTNVISFYIKIQNDGTSVFDDDNVKFSASVGGDIGEWVVSYYDAKDVETLDITSQVIGSGWTSPGVLGFGTSLYLHVKITPESPSASNPANPPVQIRMDTYPATLTTKRDTIGVKAGYVADQADVLLSNNSNPSNLAAYIGDDIFDPPTAQSLSSTIAITTWVTYYVRVENEGGSGSTDVVRITGPAGSGAWTISYYNDPSDGGDNSDITTPVTSANGWPTGALANGQSKIVRVEVMTTQGGSNSIAVKAAPEDDATKSDRVIINLSATATYKPDLMVKHSTEPDGSYLTNGTYETGTPVTQLHNTNGIVINNVESYYFRIQNDGNTSESFKLTGAASGAGTGASQWTLTYYYGSTEIPVGSAGGWTTSIISPGSSLDIYVQVKPTAGANGDTKDILVNSSSVSDPNIQDATMARPSLTPVYQIDAQFSTDDVSYTGNMVYDDTAPPDQAGQVKSQFADWNQMVTYYIMLENDGGDNDTITVTGTAGDANWIVSYYDAVSGGTQISSSVTGNGWSSGSMTPAQQKKIRVNVTPQLTASPGASKNADVVLTSWGDLNKKDMGRCTTTVTDYKVDNRIMESGGTWGVNDVGNAAYSSDPSSQNLGTNKNNNQVSTYYIRIENEGNATAGYSVTGNAGTGSGWTISYFSDPNNNTESGTTSDDIEISFQITGTGWSAVNVAAGSYKTIYARITPDGTVTGGTSKVVPVWSTNLTTDQRDACQVTVSVIQTYQVDELVSNQPSAGYIGDNTYYPPLQSDAGVNLSVVKDNIASYYVRVENEGNASETFSITGTAAGTGPGSHASRYWSVSYFIESSPGSGNFDTNITSNVTNGAGGYGLTINGLSNQRVNVRVTPNKFVGQNVIYPVDVWAVSKNDPQPPLAQDAVGITTTCTTSYQPDVIGMQYNETWYTNPGDRFDDDNYTPPAARETEDFLQTMAGDTITYFVRIMNDGNFDQSFTVSGSSSTDIGPNWTVSYFVAGNNRTTDISNGTYSTFTDQGATIQYRNSAAAGYLEIQVRVTPSAVVPASEKRNVIVKAYPSSVAVSETADRVDSVELETEALSSYKPDTLVRTESDGSGNFSGDMFYGDPINASEQKAALTYNAPQPTTIVASYYIRIDNDANNVDTITVTGSASNAQWIVSYYVENNGTLGDSEADTQTTTNDITAQMSEGSLNSFAFSNVPALTGIRYIRVTISAVQSQQLAGGTARTTYVGAISTGDNTQRDRVQLTTTVQNNYQADGMIKNWEADYSNQPPYATDDTYQNPTWQASYTQSKTQVMDRTKPASYYIRIQNDGNSNSAFTVSGTASWTNWTVTYYDDGPGFNTGTFGNNVTAQVIGGTYNLTSGELPSYEGAPVLPTKGYLRVHVEPGSGTADAEIGDVYVYSYSANGGTVQSDSCRARVQVNSPNQPDLYIRNQGESEPGDLVLDNSYTPLQVGIASQSKGNTVNKNNNITYYVWLQNDGTGNDSFTLTAQEAASVGGGTWTTTYYYDADNNDTLSFAADTNITANVKGAGQVLPPAGNWAQNERRRVWVLVNPDENVPGSTTYTITMTAQSTFLSTKEDQCRAITTLNNNYQTDARVKKEGGAYNGAHNGSPANPAGYENPPPTTQVLATENINRFSTISYYVKIDNDGNVIQNISVAASATSANWSITYYQDDNEDGVADGDGNITASVTGNGWSKTYLIGGTKSIRIEVTPGLYASPATDENTIITLTGQNGAGRDSCKVVTHVNNAQQGDAWVKEQGGSYIGNNGGSGYEDPVNTQIKTLLVNPLSPATYYIMLQNDGNINDTITISSTETGNSSWSVSYYQVSGYVEITNNVITGGGWATVSLTPADTREVALVVTPQLWPPNGGATYQVNLTISGSGGMLDKCRATTTVNNNYLPDNWISTTQATYNGSADGQNVWSPTVQNKLTWINNGQAATYYVTVQNDGNVNDAFTVTGASGDSSWTVTYYRMDTQADITPAITGGTWRFPAAATTAPGTADTVREIRVVVAPIGFLPGNSVKTVNVISTSEGQSGKTDTVTAETRINFTSKPDAWYSYNDAAFVGNPGNDLYSPAPDNISFQTDGLRTVNPAATLTYYIRVQNDGNGPETFSITSSAVNANWTITYYLNPAYFGAPNGNVAFTGGQSLNRGMSNQLANGANFDITVYVTPGSNVIGGDTQTLTTGLKSSTLAPEDAVRFQTQCNTVYRPDNLTMKEFDGDDNPANVVNYHVATRDVYDPTGQTYTPNPQSIANNQAVTYFIRIENEGNINDNFTVTGSSAPSGWTVTYYSGTSGTSDITGQVQAGTYPLNGIAAFTGVQYIRALVNPGSSSGGSTMNLLVKTTAGNGSTTDTVNVNLQVGNVYQPDCLIRRGNGSEPTYTDVDARDNGTWGGVPPASEIRSLNTVNLQAATYYVEIENDGNNAEVMTVSGTASGSGWTISYYTAGFGTDITNQVTVAPYYTPLVNNWTTVIILVTPDATVSGGVTKQVFLQARSSQDGTKNDLVRADTTVPSNYQADLLISPDAVPANFVGNGPGTAYEYPTPGAGQTITKSAAVSQLVEYYVRVQNDGNQDDRFSMNTDSVDTADWTITYYYDSNGDNTPDTIIADATLDAGYVVPVTVTAASSLWMKVELYTSNALAPNKNIILTAASVGNNAQRDSCQASTQMATVYVSAPGNGKVVGPEVVVFGKGFANNNVQITQSGNPITTTVADANGMFRVRLTQTDGLQIASNTPIVAISNAVSSQANNITVSAVAPVTVPVITSPTDGQIVLTGRPVIIGNAGVVNAGQNITAQVNVENSGSNQLFDFNAGTVVVQADGSFSLTISPTLVTSLPSGTRYLSVTCNGISSALIRVIIIDPFGILFDSKSNQPINGATVTLERLITETGVWQNAAIPADIAGPAGVANPQTSGWTGTTGQYQYDNNIGTYAYKIFRLRITAPGYTFPSATGSFPGGWGRTIYTDNVGAWQSGENVSLGGALWLGAAEGAVNADLPLDPGNTLLKINKKTNKKEVMIGDIITYEVTVQNENGWTVGSATSPVYIQDILPPGFKYIEESTSMKTGAATIFTKVTDPTGGRTRMFNIGQVAGSSTTILRYQLVVGAGVTFGEYKNLARAVYADGWVISNDAHRKVMVVPDPLFDYSTIIGKVFNDRNQNGVQDMGETGVKGVKIATADGILITTDQDGKYHIAGIEPHTQLIKLDEGSLPLGSRLTTANPQVIRFTLGGNLAKMNFGVLLPSTMAEVGPRGEVVVPVEITIAKELEMTLRLGGQVIPLQWTQPFEEKVIDETEALRVQIEKWRVESDDYRKQGEDRLDRSEKLKIQAEKSDNETVKTTLLKRSEDLRKEGETLVQQARELSDKAEAEAAKIQSETDALKTTMDQLSEQVKQLTDESEDLNKRSADLRTEADNLKEADKITADLLLDEANRLKEQARAKQNDAQQLNKEIVRLNDELNKQKVFARKRRAEPQVKINGQTLTVDPEKGYQDDVVLPLDTKKIDIWIRDAKGRETKWVKAVSVPQLQVSVYRSDEPVLLAPNLMVALTPEILQIKTGRLERAAQFIIKSNYLQFIEQWKLEIFAPAPISSGPEQERKIGKSNSPTDQQLAPSDNLLSESEPESLAPRPEALSLPTLSPPEGYRLFKEFSGSHKDISRPVTWNGRSDDGQLVQPDTAYRYRLTVQDRYGEVDRTKEGQFTVVSTWAKKIRDAMGISPAPGEEQLGAITAIGFDDQNIRTKGQVYRLSGTTNKGNKINIATPNVTDMVLVTPLEDGSFESELYVPITEETLWVEAMIPEGYLRFRLAEDIKVSEERAKQPVFLTMIADSEYGSNTVSGNNAAVEHNPRFDDGTYFQGRLAYYLKKQWGSYDITSSLDTDRYKNNYQKPLFKYIDPDKFYPVYGDNSIRVDDATGTQGKFYLNVVKGESYGTWGSYHTGFTGTELSQYNRSLYGAKLHYQPQAASSLPQTTIFAANALQLASHDELRGTGGSLYYLKYKNVISGSEKIAVEVRDKISGLLISSKVMTEGQDYEIDYDQGRIIFYKPVPSVDSGTNTIISTDLLDGNHVYVVVDYEYQPDSRDRKTASGVRLIENLGSGIDIGVTRVQEDKELEDYTLTGGDIRLNLGKSSDLTAEFASSQSESVRGNISYTGGLDYTSLPTSETSDGSAYKIQLTSDLGTVFSNKPGDVRFNLTYQKIEAGFSSGQSIFSQGTNKISGDITAKMSKHDSLLLRFDDQKLLDNGNAASRTQTGADKNQSLTAQWTHIKDQMKITGEFRQQKSTAPVSSPLLEDDTSQFLAARADYQVNKKVSVFGEAQGALSGEPENHQYTVGANALLNEKMTGSASFTFGELGSAAVLGLTSKLNDRTSMYTNYQITEDTSGQKNYTTVFGESTQLNARTKIYREERFQGRRGAEDGLYGGVFGADYALTDKWAVMGSYERSQIDTDTTQTTRDAFALGATFNSHPKVQDPTRVAGYTKFTTRAEYRSEEGGTDRTSYLTANKLFYQVNPDLNVLAKAYYSKTDNDTTSTTEAEFTEATIGLAYRPVKNDKHNFLGKISYQADQSPPVQGDLQTLLRKAMIFSTESAVDLPNGFQIVSKLAYKQQKEETGAIGELTSNTTLIALRGNYRLKSDSKWLNDWLTGLEYRIKSVSLAEDKKTGVVLEFERELHKRINFGFGYNFTDFTDELSVYDDEYDVKGWFVRLTAKY